MDLLQSYLWPGNVRELRNVIERIFVENYTEVIGARAFTEWVRERNNFIGSRWDEVVPSQNAVMELAYDPQFSPVDKKNIDLDAIKQAYRVAEGNLSGAARLLGVHRATLYRHLQRLGVKRDQL